MVMEQRIARLRRFNLIAGVLHAAQAAAVLALSNDFAFFDEKTAYHGVWGCEASLRKSQRTIHPLCLLGGELCHAISLSLFWSLHLLNRKRTHQSCQELVFVD